MNRILEKIRSLLGELTPEETSTLAQEVLLSMRRDAALEAIRLYEEAEECC